MPIRLGNYNFTPRLWPTLATLLVFPLLISLGMWQLDRAEQKRTLYERYQQRREAAALDLNLEPSLRMDTEGVIWRRIKARGRFDEQQQILLDNQVMNMEAGYFIYTPFRLEDEDIWYLVNRGWLPLGPDRHKAPQFKESDGVVTITALAKAPPQGGIKIGENIPELLAPGVTRSQYLDLSQQSERLGIKLMPYVLRLEPESEHGYARTWHQPGSGEAKHLGYAFQWFVMAALLVVIFIVVNTHKRSRI